MRVKHPFRTILNLVVRKAPMEAQLIVTRRCNLSCGYCTEYDNVSAMIPLATLKERIDALHRLRVINISILGGEPLMHPELPAIIAHGDRHAQVSVTTNGYLITEDLIDRLNASGLRNMQVSIDTVKADHTGYIQKCLKTVWAKLDLLRRFATFDVHINLVLCESSRDEFKDTLRELNDRGFRIGLDLLHDSTGRIAIGGPEYLDLWEHYYAHGHPFTYLEQDYGTRLLKGERPKWKCGSGSRFLYVDEFGKVQLCSAQRGRLTKPVVEYTERDMRERARSHQGCEEGCSLLCHYRDSALENGPLHTLASTVRMLARRRPVERIPVEVRAPRPPRPAAAPA